MHKREFECLRVSFCCRERFELKSHISKDNLVTIITIRVISENADDFFDVYVHSSFVIGGASDKVSHFTVSNIFCSKDITNKTKYRMLETRKNM
jgi:hypothetical protein